ncbi:hypothetical protein PIB30_099332, partial [Stylosanthes scabra]|nr:hypothetical protein [Stylosanthes scabra]
MFEPSRRVGTELSRIRDLRSGWTRRVSIGAHGGVIDNDDRAATNRHKGLRLSETMT